MSFPVILILCACALIFFGTLMIKVPQEESDELMTKVRLSTNGIHRDGWCRVLPGVGVKYYGIDGTRIENLDVNILLSYETDEQPPIINEEDSFNFTVDCEPVPALDHILRRAS